MVTQMVFMTILEACGTHLLQESNRMSILPAIHQNSQRWKCVPSVLQGFSPSSNTAEDKTMPCRGGFEELNVGFLCCKCLWTSAHSLHHKPKKKKFLDSHTALSTCDIGSLGDVRGGRNAVKSWTWKSFCQPSDQQCSSEGSWQQSQAVPSLN